MSARRAVPASLLILAAGVAVLAFATDGFRAFTTETARRLDVRARPRPVPAVALESADGSRMPFTALRGRWLLVDFIYTRCTTWCVAQGGAFARLQDSLAAPINRGQVMLVSVSFDPAHDDPARLADYLHHSGDRGAGWIAARPTEATGLEALMRTFGVTAVPDGLGGFVHNSAIAVVDPAGRLVTIVDWNDAPAAARYVTDRLGS
ncbi:MAG: SCO family protein [Gemmatimonadaceae bacterium]|nr:SCO family protein [Gemmatimonadaceae bacterium]